MSTRYEKCDYIEATHIMLADGATVRKIRMKWMTSSHLEVDGHWPSVDMATMELFAATLVREVTEVQP